MKLPFVSALYTWAADKTNIFQVYQPTGVYTSRQRRKLVSNPARLIRNSLPFPPPFSRSIRFVPLQIFQALICHLGHSWNRWSGV